MDGHSIRRRHRRHYRIALAYWTIWMQKIFFTFLGHPAPICSGWWRVMSWQYNEMSRNEKQGQKVLNTILKKTSKTSQAAVGVPKLLSAEVLSILVMYSYE